MSSILRRISTSLQSSGDSSSSNNTHIFRRKSSSAASASSDADADPTPGVSPSNFRVLGARDWQQAVDPKDIDAQRSSVTSMMADVAVAELAAQNAEKDGVEVVGRSGKAKGSGGRAGRTYGARDWRMIGRKESV